tara:strand:- start:273 stop:635 length:363 start_codon:yes stop_codon:yes gene_type:complete
MTEEKIKELVLNEKGITYSTDFNDYERADYVIGDEETRDGYTFYSIRDNKGNYMPSELDSGLHSIFMYESGLGEEIAQIIENNSSKLLYFETDDDILDNIDWELLAENIGLEIEEEEEEK